MCENIALHVPSVLKISLCVWRTALVCQCFVFFRPLQTRIHLTHLSLTFAEVFQGWCGGCLGKNSVRPVDVRNDWFLDDPNQDTLRQRQTRSYVLWTWSKGVVEYCVCIYRRNFFDSLYRYKLIITDVRINLMITTNWPGPLRLSFHNHSTNEAGCSWRSADGPTDSVCVCERERERKNIWVRNVERQTTSWASHMTLPCTLQTRGGKTRYRNNGRTDRPCVTRVRSDERAEYTHARSRGVWRTRVGHWSIFYSFVTANRDDNFPAHSTLLFLYTFSRCHCVSLYLPLHQHSKHHHHHQSWTPSLSPFFWLYPVSYRWPKDISWSISVCSEDSRHRREWYQWKRESVGV